MCELIYMASPYTHADPAVREERYLAACKGAAMLMRQGYTVFSPIAHSHGVEIHGLNEVMDGEFWKRQDIPLLRRADKLVVLCLPGWEKSKGIEWEVNLAKQINLPVEFVPL